MRLMNNEEEVAEANHQGPVWGGTVLGFAWDLEKNNERLQTG
jgi:hypothetical protein